MLTLRKLVLAAFLSVLAWISAGLVIAQTVDAGPFFRISGRQVIRFWQDYHLRQGETARHVFVVNGATTIAGYVNDDVIAIFGPVRIDSTAEIRGSLVVIGGNATIAEGAVVRHDLLVYGGSTDLPAAFYPGGQHISIGNAWMGDRLRAFVPWVTYGLLWGRLIVLSIGWVWWFVAVSLVLTLFVNLMLHSAVGQSADTLAARPASTFMTGLLMMLLTGPVAVLLGATVIGLAIVPFLLCAVFVAWIAGKVAVSRWIGRTILGHGSEETRAEGLTAVFAGFVALCLLYTIPIVGIVTWALVGVFGLGAATLTVLTALRRERGPKAAKPPKVKKGEQAPTEAPDSAGGSMPIHTPLAPSEARYQQAEPMFEPQTVPPIPHVEAAAYESAIPPVAGSLAAMPRAQFADRFAAGVLDVVFILFVFNVFMDRWVYRDEDVQLFLLFAYFIGFWAWKGTTLGGMVCNLRVIKANGEPLTGADAIVRALAAVFSFVPLGLGFWWIMRDPRQQAWHDKITGTLVVKVPRDFPI
jgi:uncharacterized RDD family membrane protein YckC